LIIVLGISAGNVVLSPGGQFRKKVLVGKREANSFIFDEGFEMLHPTVDGAFGNEIYFLEFRAKIEKFILSVLDGDVKHGIEHWPTKGLRQPGVDAVLVEEFLVVARNACVDANLDLFRI
jgi:hypothetical protein